MKLKPTLSDEDYFLKFKMEGSGKSLHRDTI